MEEISCPACGHHNPPPAVFCERCDKALGEFAFVSEEMRKATHWHEAFAERATAFIGKPQFFVVHLLWFAVWVALNTGIVLMVRRWDDYPFSLLGLLLSIEAIFLSGFVLITQNRQSAFAERDARLDYEVNIRTFRELRDTRALVETLLTRIDHLEAHLSAEKSSTAAEL